MEAIDNIKVTNMLSLSRELNIHRSRIIRAAKKYGIKPLSRHYKFGNLYNKKELLNAYLRYEEEKDLKIEAPKDAVSRLMRSLYLSKEDLGKYKVFYGHMRSLEGLAKKLNEIEVTYSELYEFAGKGIPREKFIKRFILPKYDYALELHVLMLYAKIKKDKKALKGIKRTIKNQFI